VSLGRVAIAVMLAATACSSPAQAPPAQAPPADFGSAVGIFLMDRDGAGVRELVAGGNPAWSPDGSLLAFAGSDGVGNVDVYVVDAQGGGGVRLTNALGHDSVPTWSPDGDRIAFMSDRDGNDEIYAMNSDGSEQTRLTDTPWSDAHPTWSPDGSRIAFDGGPPGEHDIYLIDPQGGSRNAIVTRPGDQWFPAWSPDGRGIAYGDATDGRIYLGILDPHGSLGLSVTIADGYAPRWSPGQRILFLHGGDLFSVRPTGLHMKRLTTTPEEEGAADWAPGGAVIAFARVAA